jgi:tripartite-type tricarboxylate transporter receptor subunit TctC
LTARGTGAGDVHDHAFLDRVHQAGKLRPLAVTTATRSDALPNLPTVGNFLPGYDASDWYGIGAPSNTPEDRASSTGDQ